MTLNGTKSYLNRPSLFTRWISAFARGSSNDGTEVLMRQFPLFSAPLGGLVLTFRSLLSSPPPAPTRTILSRWSNYNRNAVALIVYKVKCARNLCGACALALSHAWVTRVTSFTETREVYKICINILLFLHVLHHFIVLVYLLFLLKTFPEKLFVPRNFMHKNALFVKLFWATHIVPNSRCNLAKTKNIKKEVKTSVYHNVCIINFRCIMVSLIV